MVHADTTKIEDGLLKIIAYDCTYDDTYAEHLHDRGHVSLDLARTKERSAQPKSAARTTECGLYVQTTNGKYVPLSIALAKADQTVYTFGLAITAEIVSIRKSGYQSVHEADMTAGKTWQRDQSLHTF